MRRCRASFILALASVSVLAACPPVAPDRDDGDTAPDAGEGEGEGEGDAPGDEVCDNTDAGSFEDLDDDGDGLANCADPDCANDIECRRQYCSNREDDDPNTLFDCELYCSNLEDDDSDLMFDCFNEPDCVESPVCDPGTTVVGALCSVASDCQATERDPICLRRNFTDTYGRCSEFCASDDGCLNGGRCFLFPPDLQFGICYAPCDLDSDCGDASLICEPLPERTDGARACILASVCGNSWIEPREECDDWNTEDGDGCSATCELEQ